MLLGAFALGQPISSRCPRTGSLAADGIPAHHRQSGELTRRSSAVRYRRSDPDRSARPLSAGGKSRGNFGHHQINHSYEKLSDLEPPYGIEP